MKLIIVESPTKCETIKKYLGKDFEVVASFGHIRDLSTTGKGGLGVNIEDDFKPTYIINKDKGKVVANLKKYASFNMNELIYKLSNFNEALFDPTVFSDFSLWFMNVIRKGSVIVLTLIMVFLLLICTVGKMLLSENDKEPGKKSAAYSLYCFLMEKILFPVWKVFKDFVFYFWERKAFRYLFIISWLIAFNLLTFVVGFFAFY